MTPHEISFLIDASPMNRGMLGAEWLEEPGNIAIEINGNVMLFEPHGEGIFEFHWLHTATKGKQAIADTREALRRMFDDHGASALFGFTPLSRKDALTMVRLIGAKTLPGDRPTVNGPCRLSMMTREILEGKMQ